MNSTKPIWDSLKIQFKRENFKQGFSELDGGLILQSLTDCKSFAKFFCSMNFFKKWNKVVAE